MTDERIVAKSATKMWEGHHQATFGRAPAESLVTVVRAIKHRGLALDLGAGALNDTRYLLDEGFEHVVAVDMVPSIEKWTKGVDASRLSIVAKKFQEYDFPPQAFDVINAQRALSFIPPSDFVAVIEKLKRSLSPGGVFVGDFFGTEHQFRNNVSMSFVADEKRVRQLFHGFETHVEAFDYERQDDNRKPMRWQGFTVTAHRPSDQSRTVTGVPTSAHS